MAIISFSPLLKNDLFFTQREKIFFQILPIDLFSSGTQCCVIPWNLHPEPKEARGSYLISQDSLGTEVNCGKTIHTDFFENTSFDVLKVAFFQATSGFRGCWVLCVMAGPCRVIASQVTGVWGSRILCLPLGRTGMGERSPLPGRGTYQHARATSQAQLRSFFCSVPFLPCARLLQSSSAHFSLPCAQP